MKLNKNTVSFIEKNVISDNDLSNQSEKKEDFGKKKKSISHFLEMQIITWQKNTSFLD